MLIEECKIKGILPFAKLARSAFIAKKIFQDCQSFLGPNCPIFYIPEIETHPMSGLEKNSISLAERNDALSRVI